MPTVTKLGDSAVDKLFLEYILPGMNIELRENTVLYDRFETDIDSVVGKYAVFKCLTASPKSARPSSSSTFPTAKQGTYDEFRLYMKRGMYATLQFENLALVCSKGKGAVIELLKSETQAIMIYIANKMNRQFWGDGSGRLAQLDAGSSNSPTVNINHPFFGTDSNGYTDARTYLDDGMAVDIIHSTTGALEAEDVDISSSVDQNDGTAYLTMAEAVVASDDSWIFDTDTYASTHAAGVGVPMGLKGIVDTANPYLGITPAYFQSVDRDAYSWAQAYTQNHSSAAITSVAMLKAIQNVEKFGRVKVIITNDVIWRALYEIISADKTMPNEPAFWTGTTGLTFYGGRAGRLPIIYDTDCPDARMYFLDTDYLQVYAPTKNGMQFLPGDSGSILTRVQGKDEFVANLVFYYNFGTVKPKALGVLYGIKHASS